MLGTVRQIAVENNCYKMDAINRIKKAGNPQVLPQKRLQQHRKNRLYSKVIVFAIIIVGGIMNKTVFWDFDGTITYSNP